MITSPSDEAPSPTLSLLDEIALALDRTSLVLSNWYTLALKLGVSRKTCWTFKPKAISCQNHVLKIAKSTTTFTNGDFPQLRIRLPKEFRCSISEECLKRLALLNLPSTKGLSVAFFSLWIVYK